MSNLAISPSLSDPPATWAPRSRLFDKHLIAALLVAVAVLVPRSLLISWSQSERVDDEYHLVRGIEYLKRHLDGRSDLPLNDPPLGEGICALPLWLARCWPHGKLVTSALYGHWVSTDAILAIIAAWKALLFVPLVGVAFIWCRKLYGVQAAWLAAALLLIEPTIAAHVPIPALDVLGLEGIVIACFLWWRYFERPAAVRLVIASVVMGAAMMIKHTAVILPGVALLFALMWWVVRPWRSGELSEHWRSHGRGHIGAMISAALLTAFTIWGLCFFDFARPPLWSERARTRPGLARLAEYRMPAATYIGSFLEGGQHADEGHQSYLFGQKHKSGLWYYFPVVATYKVPLGIAAILLLGLISAWRAPPRWEEWGLLMPMFAWTVLMMAAKINIGFRHFLPAYCFMLLVATRVLSHRMFSFRISNAVVWSCLAVAAIHTLTYHPDYLCYINFPRHKAYLDISDSNVDWGQGLKALCQWIDAHPDRKIYVRDFGWGPPRMESIRRRLGDKAIALDRGDRLPREGVLLISVVPVAGVYERSDPFRILRPIEPDEVLAHSVLVYDLDRLRGSKPFIWPRYKPPPKDENGKDRPLPKGWPLRNVPWG